MSETANSVMIYLDNNATTQPSSRVVEAMLPYLTSCYFNPSSSNTVFTGVDKARSHAAINMAQLLNAEGPECFVFTSGATESNNWVFNDLLTKKNRGRVIVSATEHASVFEPATVLRDYQFEVIEASVDRDGLVILDELAEILSNETLLVSIIAANNETGVLQPLEKVGTLVRERSPKALFHTDATQAIGKISVDLQGLWSDVDLLSFSAHKFHGPKGIGGLYIREALKLEPMLRGGGQERGLRSGTINTPALAGLAAALADIRHINQEGIRRQRDNFEKMLLDEFPDVVIHSRCAERLPNTSMFSFNDMIGEEVANMLAVDSIIVGTGSACSSGAGQPSRTMMAMGVPYNLADGSLRVSICADTPSSFAERLIESISRRI